MGLYNESGIVNIRLIYIFKSQFTLLLHRENVFSFNKAVIFSYKAFSLFAKHIVFAH